MQLIRNILFIHHNYLNVYKSNFLHISKRSFKYRRISDKDGMKLAPKSYFEVPREDRLLPGLFKSYIFTTGFCVTAFGTAIIWQHERIKKSFQSMPMTDWVKTEWNKFEGWDSKEGDFRKTMNRWWNSIPEGKKIFWYIFAANTFVFLCWRHPNLQGTMLKYFCTSPAAKAVCWPMLFSNFSHYSPMHLLMNMYVLHSFSNAVCNTMGPEQFLAFYFAGGVISSLASQTVKVASKTLGPSLGASGAIMALLGYFCTKYPDAQLGIVFLPNMPFSAELAIKGVICLDTVGIILRWKLFDHAAHLGGALFGVMYAKFGESYLRNKHNFIIKKWEILNRKYFSKKDDR